MPTRSAEVHDQPRPTTPTNHGEEEVVYTMALVIVDDVDQDRVREALIAVLDRRRPLHWESEGTVVKHRVVDLLGALAAAAHVCSSIVHRSEQQAARVRLLRDHLLDQAGAAGAGQLLIEQRCKAEDDSDRRESATGSARRRTGFMGSSTSRRPSRWRGWLTLLQVGGPM
jgi:hypothetical protein